MSSFMFCLQQIESFMLRNATSFGMIHDEGRKNITFMDAEKHTDLNIERKERDDDDDDDNEEEEEEEREAEEGRERKGSRLSIQQLAFFTVSKFFTRAVAAPGFLDPLMNNFRGTASLSPPFLLSRIFIHTSVGLQRRSPLDMRQAHCITRICLCAPCKRKLRAAAYGTICSVKS